MVATARRAVANAAPWPAFFGTMVAVYTSITVSRLNEVVPFLGRLYLGKVGAALLLVACLAGPRNGEFAEGFKTTVMKCMLVITVLAFASVPGSAWPKQSVTFFQVMWPQTILMFVGVLVGFMDMRTAWITIVAVTATAALGALELIVGGGLSTMGRGFIGSDVSATLDPNASAALFVTMLPYGIFLATRRGRLKTVGIAMIPIFVAGIVRTSSRGGILALGALAIALIAFAPKKRRAVYAGVLVVMVATVFLVPHSGLADRFSDLSGSQDYNFNSRDGRIEIWKRGIGMMLTHPILGVGVRAYEVANGNLAHSWMNAHNSFIQIGAELGVGGLIALITAIVVVFRMAVAARKRTAARANGSSDMEFEHALLTAAICSLVAELAAAMFLSMAYDTMTLFALAVPTGVALHVFRSRRVPGAAAQPTVGQAAWRSARRVPRPLPAPRPTA
jgi:O-antigen ligase